MLVLQKNRVLGMLLICNIYFTVLYFFHCLAIFEEKYLYRESHPYLRMAPIAIVLQENLCLLRF